ncbi:MAG: peptidylprolyl isomerase [Phycisphaerae bacterium]
MKLNFNKLSCLIIITMLLVCIGCEPKKSKEEKSEPAQAQTTSQAPKASEPASVKTSEPAKQVLPTDIAVTVNGINITEGEIDEMIRPQLERMMANARGRGLPENALEDAKKRLHDQGVEASIFNQLIDADMKKHNVVVSDEEIDEFIEKMSEQQNMTVDDLKTMIEAAGQDYSQWKKNMHFDKRIAINKLVEIRGIGTVEVDDSAALEYYNNNQQQFHVPEQVRARHILIKPDTSDPNTDPDAADAKALEQAQQILQQIKDGADFAEMAEQYSACPSAAQGGDLGYGEKRSWVGPFADAAFALEPGQVSDVVQTRFGYHIIESIDHKPETQRTFDEVKENLIDMLKAQKEQELMIKYLDVIKGEANIVYPPGKEPAEQMTPSTR